jgi:hypothetical protein
MNEEIEKLKKELSEVESELDKVRLELKLKEDLNSDQISNHKNKWDQKHSKLIREIRSIQETYDREKKSWQEQMLLQSETLNDLKHRASREEEAERKFLHQIDAELLAVAGRAQARSSSNSISQESDTLFDSMHEDHPEETNQILHAIFKSRELIRQLLEKSSSPLQSVPPLPPLHTPTFEFPDISKSLTESYASLYSKILVNDELLNSLSMSEREAVVYSLINSGAAIEEKRDVQLEDLLNVTDANEKLVLSSGRFEDLSSIIEEDSGQDSAKKSMGLTFSLPDVKVNDFESYRVKNLPNEDFSSIGSGSVRDKESYSEVDPGETNELDKAVFERDSFEDGSLKKLEKCKVLEKNKKKE